MNASVAYLDTSAFLKLVVSEPESSTLRRFLLRWPQRTSAALLRTESVRALRRAGYGQLVGSARRLLKAMPLIHLDELLLDSAAELDPPELRSLDALHLAAALRVGSDLGVFITYDERLGSAARERGLLVDSPV
jgi:predicted nucleic acid-binding protein